MLSENPFAKIIAGQLPADVVYETPTVIAFRDIKPQAKTHILICPKEEIQTAMHMEDAHEPLFGQLFTAARQVAALEGLKGYKLHMNVGDAGGQVVPHVHLHLLSGDWGPSL